MFKHLCNVHSIRPSLRSLHPNRCNFEIYINPIYLWNTLSNPDYFRIALDVYVLCVCVFPRQTYTQGFSLLTLMQFDFDFLQFRLLKKFTHSVAYFIIQVKDSRRNVTYSLLFQIWLKSRFLFCKTERVLDSFHIIFEIDSFTCIDCDIW